MKEREVRRENKSASKGAENERSRGEGRNKKSLPSWVFHENADAAFPRDLDVVHSAPVARRRRAFAAAPCPSGKPLFLDLKIHH